MVRTGLSRPAFYAYFRDRYDLVTRLLEGIGGLLFAVDWRWLSGEASEGREAASEVLVGALRRGSRDVRAVRAGVAGDIRRGGPGPQSRGGLPARFDRAVYRRRLPRACRATWRRACPLPTWIRRRRRARWY
jgi:AcrR family transcriptional regulator